MPADASNTTSRTALLRHLDRVYEMARVLAPSEKRASKLVEATYRRAAQSTPPSAHDKKRAWLFRLLLQTYATRRSEAATTSSVSTMRRPADLLQDFRFQTAEDALQRAVPVAFALQAPREQLVLTLCEIIELDVAEAAVVLDTDPDALADEATSARDALWESVRTELTDGERALVAEELPNDALLDALRRVVAPHLGSLPATLRPSVTTIVEQTPPEANESDIGDFDAPAPIFAPPTQTASSDPPPVTRSSTGERLQRFGLALLIIVATGLAGYLLSSLLTSDPEPAATDLLQLSVQRADAVQPSLQTNSLQEAEQFVREQLGRRLTVPDIDGATLRGVSLLAIESDVRVPVFLFEDDASNQRFTTYAYTYALLDRLAERVQLTPEMRHQLQDEERITLQTLDENGILLWRKHDDIYVTVTKADPRQVRPRIAHSS